MSTYTAFPATPQPKQYFPDSAPAEIKAVVRWVEKVYGAQYMGDMAGALKRLVPDVDWTLPFIEFHNAGGDCDEQAACCAPLPGWVYIPGHICYSISCAAWFACD
jgi:hypothetical protein